MALLYREGISLSEPHRDSTGGGPLSGWHGSLCPFFAVLAKGQSRERLLTDTWNPDQYRRFERERDAPFFDLLSGLPKLSGKRAVDLGCGTGKLTAEVHRHLELGDTLGVDSSSAMLAEAASHQAPGLHFQRGTIEAFASKEPLDLIISNAALQWTDDHPALLVRLKSYLAPNGWLAVQVPANHNHLSHRVAAEVAGESPFQEALGGYRRVSPVLALEAYSEILARAGFPYPIVQMRAYLHRLPSRQDVVEWVKGTLLTDYQKRMPSGLWDGFLKRYREKLLPQLVDETPFLYPFLRTFLWAKA